MAVAAGLSIAGGTRAPAASEPFVIPFVDVVSSGSGLVITGRVVALSPAPVTATLAVERAGVSGTVTSSQQRSVNLELNQSATIAEIGISFVAGDRLTAIMRVSSGNAIIATTRLDLGGTEQ